MTTKRTIAVYRCANHPDIYTLCVDNADGGTRLTGTQCCTRQYDKRICQWLLTERMAEGIQEELANGD